MERMILHSDINACYASIELLRHPELRGRPVAVGGEQELRHGIILAKDQMARAAGVRTGMTLWAARQQCPELTILPPDFDLYYDYSRRVRQVYADFTDRCEPFGMDECWLDMTGCVGHEDALQTAQAVRQLERLGIRTVGALAAADADMLRQRFGKSGVQLHAYANGYDPAPVHRVEDLPPPKSIGNSATAPRDLICEADARAALLSLSESVGARLRLEGYQCRTVELSVRTADLRWCSHRMALRHPTDLTSEVLDAALALCEQAHLWPEPLRSIGVRALDLQPACAPHQMDLFEDAERRARQRRLDITLDNLRARYGKTCVLRGRACFDPALGLVQREEHAFLRK